jgi:general stress protein 26
MTEPEYKSDAAEVSRLLAGAAEAIASVRYCWLVTDAEAGLGARPMGRLPHDLDEDNWLIRFITDGRSRKASDIRRAGKVAVIFQREADDAYVSLIGAAALRGDASTDRRRWKDAYNAYFPTEQDRANAAFIEIDIERMELWIRGVTPEPFGLRPAVLERGAGGAWRLTPFLGYATP